MRLLVAEEVGEMLRARPATILDWARAGAIPHVRIGRSVRFSEPELQRWIAGQIESRWPECAVVSGPVSEHQSER